MYPASLKMQKLDSFSGDGDDKMPCDCIPGCIETHFLVHQDKVELIKNYSADEYSF
uniref:Uncharacterized protein n=1 Tax=Timema poppense TaxID=170557 RepID=A0A7R9HHG3_TIMPO|nr:unnamed protein product [Timema poppensis]